MDVCCGGDFGAKIRHPPPKRDDGFVLGFTLKNSNFGYKPNLEPKLELRKGGV